MKLSVGIVALSLLACHDAPTSPMEHPPERTAAPDHVEHIQKDGHMESDNTCVFVRIEPGGRVTVRRGAVEQTYDIFGIVVPSPPGPEFAEFVARRLGHTRMPLRCELRTPGPSGEPRATFTYFAMQDKSGDIWIDVALDLLDAKMARVSAESFPERQEYLDHERQGRAARP